ncbi:bifunctional phosphoglucose/phosphomannose isomerase [Thermoleophilia bacterium SCSIO 60948]|nr:bifunctional phosphoglucose/phosphomannose isomerase [Thermoleophilia bacterium SCSIO 60948]
MSAEGFLDAIRAVDPTRQLDDVLTLPDQLSDAIWRYEGAAISRRESTGLIVAGMGGSAIGGELATAVIGERLRAPILVVRDYALPAWVDERWTVLCSSYSGETEETLAAFEDAKRRGAAIYAATTGGALAERAREVGAPVVGVPGGRQPRAVIGYGMAITCELAASVGASPGLAGEIERAAEFLRGAADSLVELAAALTETIGDSTPIVAGADLTAPVAYRWKCQFNENAKLHSWSAELPELDHNEIVGWQGGAPEDGFAAIFLVDADQSERITERTRLTAGLVERAARSVTLVATKGETRTERALWAVMLGDLISLGLAARRGVDPVDISSIDELKRGLAAS